MGHEQNAYFKGQDQNLLSLPQSRHKFLSTDKNVIGSIDKLNNSPFKLY